MLRRGAPKHLKFKTLRAFGAQGDIHLNHIDAALAGTVKVTPPTLLAARWPRVSIYHAALALATGDGTLLENVLKPHVTVIPPGAPWSPTTLRAGQGVSERSERRISLFAAKLEILRR